MFKPCTAYIQINLMPVFRKKIQTTFIGYCSHKYEDWHEIKTTGRKVKTGDTTLVECFNKEYKEGDQPFYVDIRDLAFPE